MWPIEADGRRDNPPSSCPPPRQFLLEKFLHDRNCTNVHFIENYLWLGSFSSEVALGYTTVFSMGFSAPLWLKEISFNEMSMNHEFLNASLSWMSITTQNNLADNYQLSVFATLLSKTPYPKDLVRCADVKEAFQSDKFALAEKVSCTISKIQQVYIHFGANRRSDIVLYLNRILGNSLNEASNA